MQEEQPPLYPRSIRSFVRRSGRITAAQQQALNRYWPSFGLNYQPIPFTWAHCFGREAKTIIEIGFGMGEHLITQAQTHPDCNFIGIDVHRPGIGRVLDLIAKHQLNNIRLFCHDATEILRDCCEPASIDEIQILFPDPWPKKRHHKRRLIQTPFVDLLHHILKKQGRLHIATDWENYAHHINEVIDAHHGFDNPYGKNAFAPRPAWRTTTKFEQRGRKLGHAVWDLIVTRKD